MQEASPATYPTPSLAADRLRLAERLSARTLLLGGVMTVILALFIGVEQDPDFWWHLKIGQWMVQHGQLPSMDIFTFTATGHSWTDHEYLTEILMWLTYSTLGLAALCIAFGLLTWAGFWLLFLQVRRQPFVFVGVGLTIAAIAGSPIWGPRAQMITFALTCLELYWLRTYLSGRSLAINFFPLVMIVWANLHGGWVIGFVWLGVAIASELLSWAWNLDNPAHKMHARRLAVIAAATPILINTYGDWWKELAAAQKWKFNLPPRPAFAAVTAVALVLIIGVTALRVSNTISPERQQQLDAANYPVGAADWLAAHPDIGTRMFNQYGCGGYLAYRFYPQPNRRVFIFGEAALMGDDLLNEYADVYYVRASWKQVLDKYGVDYVVENKGDPLPNLLATQPDWKLVYEDKVAVIYVRTFSRS